MVQMLFSKIEQAPGTDYRKVGKSLFSLVLGYWYALGDEGQGKKSYYAVLNGPQPVFGGLRTTQAQTSLHIGAVWSSPLLLESIISKLAMGEISLF